MPKKSDLSRIISNTLFSLRFIELTEAEQNGNYGEIMRRLPVDTQIKLKELLSQYSASCFDSFILSPERPYDHKKDPIGPHVFSLKKCATMTQPHHFIDPKKPLAIRMYYEAQFPYIKKASHFRELYAERLAQVQDELGQMPRPSITSHFNFENERDREQWSTFLPRGSVCKVVKSTNGFMFIVETHAGSTIGKELHDIIVNETPTVQEFARDRRVKWANAMVLRNAQRIMAMLLHACDIEFLFSRDRDAVVPKHHKHPTMIALTLANYVRYNTYREHSEHVSFYHGCVDGEQMHLPSKCFIFSSHNPLCGERALIKTTAHSPVEPKDLHSMLPLRTPFEFRPPLKHHRAKITKYTHKRAYREKEFMAFHKDEYPKKVMRILGCHSSDNVKLKVVHLYPPLK
jgi:hypothetical protein